MIRGTKPEFKLEANLTSEKNTFKRQLEIFFKKLEDCVKNNHNDQCIVFNIKFPKATTDDEKSKIIGEFNQLIKETYFENNELKKNSPVIILDDAIYIDDKSLEVTVDEIKFKKYSDKNHKYNKYNNKIDKKITLIDSEPLYTIYIEKGYNSKLEAVEKLMMHNSSKQPSQYPNNENIILYLTEICYINLKKTL